MIMTVYALSVFAKLTTDTQITNWTTKFLVTAAASL